MPLLETSLPRRREQHINTNELAARGWGERLTSFVVALLVIDAITGLWIYLAPFSVRVRPAVR